MSWTHGHRRVRVTSVLVSRGISSCALDDDFRQTLLVGVAGSFGPVRDAELAIDLVQMELHGLIAEPEILRNRAIRQTSRHAPPDLTLALAEAQFRVPSRHFR